MNCFFVVPLLVLLLLCFLRCSALDYVAVFLFGRLVGKLVVVHCCCCYCCYCGFCLFVAFAVFAERTCVYETMLRFVI